MSASSATRGSPGAAGTSATAVSACWRRRTRSDVPRGRCARFHVRANASQAAGAPTTPCSAGHSRARSSANAAAAAGSLSPIEHAGPSSRWIAAPTIAPTGREIDAIARPRRRALQRMRPAREKARGRSPRAAIGAAAARKASRSEWRTTCIGASAMRRLSCYDFDTHRLRRYREDAMVSLTHSSPATLGIDRALVRSPRHRRPTAHARRRCAARTAPS